MEDFIDDSKQSMEDANFYHRLDPNNINNSYKFQNQIRDPILATYEDNVLFYGNENPQPELFAPVDRCGVELDKFDGSDKLIKKFKANLNIFEETDNPFFDSILYKIALKNVKVNKEKAREVLGDLFYSDLYDIKDEIKLYRIIFGYYDRCFTVNQTLSKYSLFLKFFERRDKFRFLIKKR